MDEARLAADAQVKEACIIAELSTLQYEKEVAIAVAEAEVFEAAAGVEDITIQFMMLYSASAIMLKCNPNYVLVT